MKTKKEATLSLFAKLQAAGFKKFASGVWWEMPDQAICVLLTPQHTDVFLFAAKSYRLQYDSPQLLDEDFDRLLGKEEPSE